MHDMEAELDALGLGTFAIMDDETAAASIEGLEEITNTLQGSDAAATVYLACLRAFVYGYKLGIRPKDTRPEKNL